MLIEDDETLRMHISEHLKRYCYNVIEVENFENVQDQFINSNPDIILLDINLPFYDGFYICKLLRRRSNVPIIIVSARSSSSEQILGIESGADDYITKPINIETMLSKIKALLRRTYGEYASSKNTNIKLKQLVLDEGDFKLYFEGKSCDLSKNEFKLAKILMENSDNYLSREELLEALWDDISFVDDNTLSVNVKRLKTRFEEFGILNLIKTKRGVGYKLDSSILKGKDNDEVIL